MFALIENQQITKFYSGNKGVTLGDIQYPRSIFTLWSEAERNAIGIFEVTVDTTNKKDEQWYNNTNINLIVHYFTMHQQQAIFCE